MSTAFRRSHQVVYWEVGNFLGVSGPLPLPGNCKTDTSPSNYVVEEAGYPRAEFENIQVSVCEFSQNQQTYDHVAVELDVIPRGYTTDSGQLPSSDGQHGQPLPYLGPYLVVEFRNLTRDLVQEVQFHLHVQCVAHHFSDHRTVGPPHSGWIQQWAGTTVSMFFQQFYACP